MCLGELRIYRLISIPLISCPITYHTHPHTTPGTMATKRPHSSVHPSRAEQVPGEPSRKRQKTKPAHITGKSFKKAHTVSDLKASIRSLKRLLSHNADLPPTVRVEKERELATAQYELEVQERAKRRSEVIGKWHKVRFFERQKAGKRVKKLKREMANCEDEGQGRELEKWLEEAEVDVNYAVYFPLERDYVPLFPRRRHDGEEVSENPAPNAAVSAGWGREGAPGMWELVRKCMKDGTLADLREGRLTSEGGEAIRKPEERVRETVQVKKQRNKDEVQMPVVVGNRRERRAAAAAAAAKAAVSGDESEDGFFE